MLIKLTINQLLMGLFEKFFRQTLFCQTLFYTSQRDRIEWVNISLHSSGGGKQ